MTQASSSRSTHVNVFRRHRRKTLSLTIFLLIVALDFSAGLLLLPKNYNNFRESHPFYHHGLLSNRAAVAKWGDGAEYPVFTNSLGLLDEAVREVSLATDKYRILVLGDSYTEGLGVPFKDTFVGLLSQKVNRDRVEILNGAVSSYCPKLYLQKTKFLVAEVGLHVDEIYVFIDISDIQDEVLYKDFEGSMPTRWATFRTGLHRFLRETSFFYGTIQPSLRKRRQEERRAKYRPDYYPPWLDYFWLDNIYEEAYSDPEFARVRDQWTLSKKRFNSHWVQLGLRSAREKMKEFVRFSKERKIKVTLAVYPWPVQIRDGNPDSIQVKIWREFSRRQKLDFIDLFPTLVTKNSYEDFRDRYIQRGDIHWTPAGHALVADRVWESMEKSLRGSGILP